MNGASYHQSAEALKRRLGSFRPEALLVLGSGLGFLGDRVEDPVFIPYSEIPHFPCSTAPGHAGWFVFGHLAGRRVAVMQGRFHTYEGYSYEEVAVAVRVMRLLDCKTLIVTNAAGAVNTAFQVGDLMLITDHIKFFGDSPLRGPNLEELGPRFPDLSRAYTPALAELCRESAAALNIPLREGVYMFFTGPQYETPAEIRAARLLGADAVGMSTVPEVIAAAHCGMSVLGLTLCTNMAAGVLDQTLSEQEVLEAGKRAAPAFSALVLKCLERMQA